MHIALLTREYVTEGAVSGGLGTYLYRLASALRDCGHTPEVFVFTQGAETQFEHDGILVHRVGHWPRFYALMRMLMVPVQNRRFKWTHRMCKRLEILAPAIALARALEARSAQVCFRLVQSADYLAPGLRVARRPDRVHLVRCSTAADLYNDTDGNWSTAERVRVECEFQAMRMADDCYAPSRLVAEHYTRDHGLKVGVVRPPAFPEPSAIMPPGLDLPPRFLLHFGKLIPRKGTWVLAEALKLAWQTDPSVAMVWAGKCWDEEFLLRCRQSWGRHSDQVKLTGDLPREVLYAVLQRAEAAVLPSLMDNLPNTVIESLVRGVPVVGTRGSSVEELVQEDISGHLVPVGDPGALSEAMLRVWQLRSRVPRRFRWDATVATEMQPASAVENLLNFAGLQHAN